MNTGALPISEMFGRIDIGIVTIREDEFAAVLSRLKGRKTIEGGRQYYDFARIRTHAGDELGVVIVRCPEKGEGVAQRVARDMLDDLHPPWLFLVGIAGGLPSDDYSLGDVVLASRLVDFSVSAAIQGELPEFATSGGPMHREVENFVAHVQALRSLRGWNYLRAIRHRRPTVDVPESPDDERLYGPRDWRLRVQASLRKHFPTRIQPRAPRVVAAPTISSNTLVKSVDLAKQWLRTARDAATVEMELGGAYEAARRGGTGDHRVLAIRGISDVIGFKRSGAWTAYACQTAAAFALALARSGTIKPRPDRDVARVRSRERVADWGDAPDASRLIGRSREAKKIRRWVLHENIRLVGVFGDAGIGKTAIASHVAKQSESQFDVVLWRSLLDAPPLDDLLAGCLQYLAPTDARPTARTDQMLSHLLRSLRHTRCLLVLDNADALLQAGERAGRYRESHVGYKQLLCALRDSGHRSSVIVTSRERLPEFEGAGKRSGVRELRLSGLRTSDVRRVLGGLGLRGNTTTWRTLANRYGGNPLALKIVSSTIREVFSGFIRDFLDDGLLAIGELHDLLESQFRRITPLEGAVLYWLALSRRPLTLDGLAEDLFPQVPRERLLEAAQSVQRRFLAERSEDGEFILQPVLSEFVTRRFIRVACHDLTNDTDYAILESHAVLRADGSDSVDATQRRLVLDPIVERATTVLGRDRLVARLQGLLTLARESQSKGYLAGNATNMLATAKPGLRGYDLSSLVLRHVDLRGIEAQDTNLSSTDIVGCSFTQTFGVPLGLDHSPDGRVLAVASSKGEVFLFQTDVGHRMRHYVGHTDWVRAVAFRRDGSVLASASEDTTVRVWDVQTGACARVLLGHQGWAVAVAFSHDGEYIASGSDDHTARLWSATKGELIQVMRGHLAQVQAVVFLPRLGSLASASKDGHIKIWDLSQGACTRTLTLESGIHARSLASLSHDDQLAAGYSDGSLALWNCRTGALTWRRQAHEGPIRALAIDPERSHLFSAGDDKLIRAWDTLSGEPAQTITGHLASISALSVTPDGRMLASGSEDQTVRQWHLPTFQPVRTLQGYSSAIWSLAFSRDGATLVTGHDDHIVRQWELSHGSLVATLSGHRGWVRSVAFDRSGRVLATGSSDRTARLWEVATGKCLRTFGGHLDRVRCVALSDDGRWLATGGYDATVRVWDTANGDCQAVLEGHDAELRAVTFIDGSRRIASAGDDGSICVWDPEAGRQLLRIHAHDGRIWSIGVSDQRRLVSCADDGYLKTWDFEGGNCISSFSAHGSPLWSLAVHPNGRLVAAAGPASLIYILDCDRGEERGRMHSNSGWVESLGFSPGGNLLASGSETGTIQVWDVSAQKCVMALKGERPYERMDISNVRGLRREQRFELAALGAIGNPSD